MAVARLRELPPAKEPSPAAKARDQVRGKHRTWAAIQRGMLETLGPDWRLPIERVIRSGAQVRMFDLQAELRDAMEAADDYLVRLATTRDEVINAEWEGIHHELDLQAHRVLRGRPFQWLRVKPGA